MKPLVHEDYADPERYSNDIALLKLAEEVNMTTYTPVCLPPLDKDYVDKIGTAYGEKGGKTYESKFEHTLLIYIFFIYSFCLQMI